VNYAKECLYDIDWQILRVDMLAQNNSYGGWEDRYGCERNVARCLAYLKDGFGYDEAERFHRVLNLMSAVLLGYGKRPEVKTNAERVRATRETLVVLRDERKLFLGGIGVHWDWEYQARRIAALKDAGDGSLIELVKKNLEGRVKTSTRRTGGTQHRPELVKFLELL
jgi:hypothetical protein